MAELVAEGRHKEPGSQQPQEENSSSSSSSGASLIEAVAIQVTDDLHHHHPQRARVVHGTHPYATTRPTATGTPTNPPVRDNSPAQCCYPITVEDPIEMIQARNVAVVHMCVEIVAVIFCSTELCGVAFFLAVLSSSIVACCCKHRTTFRLWSWIGGLLFAFHAYAAVTALEIDRFYYVSDSPALVFLLQVFLCAVNALVVRLGCVVAAALGERDSTGPVEMRIEMPVVRTSMYPIAGVQDAQVSRMLP